MDGPFRNVVHFGLDCSRGMECTVQMLAAHCVLKQSSDIVASPGTMLAPALSTDREQQQQHIPHACFSKGCSSTASCYCSICGAARHTHRHTHAHTTRTHTNTNAREYLQARTRTFTCTRPNTHAHARAHKQTSKHTGTHTRTHTLRA